MATCISCENEITRELRTYRERERERERGALTWCPDHVDDDLDDVAIAAAGQVDDEWGEPPVASGSDAHDDVEGGDAEGQLVPEVLHGPPRERDLGPALLLLGVEAVIVRPHEPNEPRASAVCGCHHAAEDELGEVLEEAGLQFIRKEAW
jgi:hypothetical protein